MMNDRHIFLLLAALCLVGVTLACGRQTETVTPQIIVATPTTGSAAPSPDEPLSREITEGRRPDAGFVVVLAEKTRKEQ